MASKFNAGGVYITSDIENSQFNKKVKEMSENANKMADKINNSAFGKLNNAFKKLSSSLAGLSAGFAALFAVKKVVDFANECSKLYKVQEQAEKKLQQMMKNAGVYTVENLNEMKAYAAELQNMSNYGDEFLMPIIADLSKAKLSTEQLKEATKQAVNLMAGGQSADMLSKVLEKPLEMSQSLRRMGILINQEELQSLSLEEQRAKVLDEINKKYGGMAEAMADSRTQFQNAFGDMKEELGKAFNAFLDPIYKAGTRLINLINPVISSISSLMKPISSIIQKIFKILPGVQATIAKFKFVTTTIKAVADILNPILYGVNNILDTIGSVMEKAFAPIKSFINLYQKWVGESVTQIKQGIEGIVYNNILDKIKNKQTLSEKEKEQMAEIKSDPELRKMFMELLKKEEENIAVQKQVAEKTLAADKKEAFSKNKDEIITAVQNALSYLSSSDHKNAATIYDLSKRGDNRIKYQEFQEALLKENFLTEGDLARFLQKYNIKVEGSDYAASGSSLFNLFMGGIGRDKKKKIDFTAAIKGMNSLDFSNEIKQQILGVLEGSNLIGSTDEATKIFNKQLLELRKTYEELNKLANEHEDEVAKEYFNIQEFTDNIKGQMKTGEKSIQEIEQDLVRQMHELIDKGKKDGKELLAGQEAAARKAIGDYILWLKANKDYAELESAGQEIGSSLDTITKDFRSLADTTNVSVKEYNEKFTDLKKQEKDLIDKQKKLNEELQNKSQSLSKEQKAALEKINADNIAKLQALSDLAIEAAKNFVDIMFEPLNELAEETTNSIGNINGGSVASFYLTNKKAKADIAQYSNKAKDTYRATRDAVQNSEMSQAEKNAAMQKASADLAAAKATADQMEATRKATATTEAFKLAMSLAADALNTAADSIVNNLEAEGDSERATDVREGAQIISDSVNNFLQGLAQGGPIMGLVMMIIGWIKELLERMGKYLHSLEAIFVSVSKAFDLVASLISPIALALEVLLTPITLLTEVLSAIADILTPIMELMADVIDLFLKPFFSIVRTVFKPLVDAVKKITSGIRESLGIGGVEDIDYSAQYDEMIGGINAILNALNEEKAILERHRALTQKINETANELYALQKGDAEAEFEKGVLTELFKTRLAEIEANKLYKDTSVNLAEYQKVIKQNGDIDIQQGKKLLFQLEHSELDANDFYAGNTEKLKELLNSLIQYQQDEDDRAVRAANAYNAQKANNAELSKIAEDFAALPEPITNSAIFLDDIQKQQSALDNTLNAYADENKELLDKGNDINQGGLSNVSEDVESTDSSVNNLTKVLLAINGHAVTNVSDYIDQVNKEIAAAEKTKQANEYRKSIYAAAERKINAASDDEYYGNYKSGAKSKVSEYINGLSEDYILKNYSNLLIAAGSIDIWDVIKNTKQVTGWYLGSKSDTASYNASAIKDQLIDEIRKRVGYATGGWTGNVPIDKISGFVHGQEYVVKAPYAADYRPMLEAINEGRGSSIFGNQSALQNVNINIDSTIRANDPLSMINEWNKELRNRNLRLELKKV